MFQLPKVKLDHWAIMLKKSRENRERRNYINSLIAERKVDNPILADIVLQIAKNAADSWNDALRTKDDVYTLSCDIAMIALELVVIAAKDTTTHVEEKLMQNPDEEVRGEPLRVAFDQMVALIKRHMLPSDKKKP